MCLTGFLAELLCCVAESVEEYEQVTTVTKEMQQTVSDSDPNSVNDHQPIQTHKKSEIVKELAGAAIQADPTISTIKNTLGAVQDYRNGEKISDIIKDRAIQMVEDQVPNVVLQHAEAELKKANGKSDE